MHTSIKKFGLFSLLMIACSFVQAQNLASLVVQSKKGSVLQPSEFPIQMLLLISVMLQKAMRMRSKMAKNFTTSMCGYLQ